MTATILDCLSTGVRNGYAYGYKDGFAIGYLAGLITLAVVWVLWSTCQLWLERRANQKSSEDGK